MAYGSVRARVQTQLCNCERWQVQSSLRAEQLRWVARTAVGDAEEGEMKPLTLPAPTPRNRYEVCPHKYGVTVIAPFMRLILSHNMTASFCVEDNPHHPAFGQWVIERLRFGT